MDEAGWQPGVFSNCWKMLYLLVSGACVVASIASLGVMFKYFGESRSHDAAVGRVSSLSLPHCGRLPCPRVPLCDRMRARVQASAA